MSNKPLSVIVYFSGEDLKAYEQVRKLAYINRTSKSKIMLSAFKDWLKLIAKHLE